MSRRVEFRPLLRDELRPLLLDEGRGGRGGLLSGRRRRTAIITNTSTTVPAKTAGIVQTGTLFPLLVAAWDDDVSRFGEGVGKSTLELLPFPLELFPFPLELLPFPLELFPFPLLALPPYADGKASGEGVVAPGVGKTNGVGRGVPAPGVGSVISRRVGRGVGSGVGLGVGWTVGSGVKPPEHLHVSRATAVWITLH